MTIKPDPNYTSKPSKSLAESNGKEITILPSSDPNAAPSEPLRADYLSHLSFQSPARRKTFFPEIEPNSPWIILTAVAVMIVGLVFRWSWIGFSGALVALLLALQIIVPSFWDWLSRYLTPKERRGALAALVLLASVAVLAHYFGVYERITFWLTTFKYDEFGSWAEWVGALGQIMIAILAVYVAWAQYVISKDLTIQQNRITQQQTIDAYFQGISDLALDEEGFLEDWPQERAIADGRTASILSNVDPSGKAQILRFLSQSKLVTPIQRDRFLGRPILDGEGGYAEDRLGGTRVVNLGVMLAGADLSGQDLRWTDVSEANMVRANLNQCDLVKANLARTVLYEASLRGADLKGARLFYGSAQTASPRSRVHIPDYETGAYTGVVIENADLTDVRNLSAEQHYYCCAWGGEKTRVTIPGGCEGIPNLLGR